MPRPLRQHGFMTFGDSLILNVSFILTALHYGFLIVTTLRDRSTSNAWTIMQSILIVWCFIFLLDKLLDELPPTSRVKEIVQIFGIGFIAYLYTSAFAIFFLLLVAALLRAKGF